MKRVFETNYLGHLLPDDVATVDFDFAPLLRRPELLALHEFAERHFNQTFRLFRPAVKDARGGALPPVSHRFPGSSAGNPFCNAIEAVSPQSHLVCLRNGGPVFTASCASKRFASTACRFGGMTCVAYEPIYLQGRFAGGVIMWGLRDGTDSPTSWNDVVSVLRDENPDADFSHSEELYAAIRPVTMETLRTFLSLARDVVTTLATRQLTESPLNGNEARDDAAELTIVGGTEAERRAMTFGHVVHTQLPVVIEGESGTGKEMVARHIHEAGSRRHKPFVAVPCATLSWNLIEAELFGFVKGAFSGAEEDFPGYFERADGGTLFFDEVSEFPLNVQSRLLRVIETGELRRIGGDQSIHVDVRVLVASSKNLRDMMENGLFSRQLFYRIHGASLSLPPLRDQPDEILLYADAFLNDYNRRHGTEKSFTDDARKTLRQFPWPGNIRQLKNTVIHAATLAGGKINPACLPETIAGYKPSAEITDEDSWILLQARIADLERRHIESVLQRCGGNKRKAAKALGLKERSFYNKLKALGL